MVWDQHLQHSIKESIRRKYGNGIRKKLISQLKSQLLGYFLKKFFEKVRIKKAIKYYYIHNPNRDGKKLRTTETICEIAKVYLELIKCYFTSKVVAHTVNIARAHL